MIKLEQISESSFEDDLLASDEKPIHYDKDGWWFWDEYWCDRYGPYKTKAKVEFKYKEYCKALEKGFQGDDF